MICPALRNLAFPALPTRKTRRRLSRTSKGRRKYDALRRQAVENGLNQSQFNRLAVSQFNQLHEAAAAAEQTRAEADQAFGEIFGDQETLDAHLAKVEEALPEDLRGMVGEFVESLNPTEIALMEAWASARNGGSPAVPGQGSGARPATGGGDTGNTKTFQYTDGNGTPQNFAVDITAPRDGEKGIGAFNNFIKTLPPGPSRQAAYKFQREVAAAQVKYVEEKMKAGGKK